MDLLQAFLGLVIPPTALCVLLVLWPALTVRSFILRFFRALFEESLRGKIVAITGATSCLGQAAKAAVMNFFDTLRLELGYSIGGITIVMPGWIESEMTMGKFINKKGNIELQEDKRDQQIGPLPVASAEDCAKAVIHGVARGHHYVRFPSWYTVLLLYRVFAPEVLDTLLYAMYLRPSPGRKDGATLSKVFMEIPGMKSLLYPPSICK